MIEQSLSNGTLHFHFEILPGEYYAFIIPKDMLKTDGSFLAILDQEIQKMIRTQWNSVLAGEREGV